MTAALMNANASSARWTNLRYAGLVVLLLAIGVAARVYLVVYLHPLDRSVYSDMENYVRLSEAILNGEWNAQLFFQPIGYPMLLARLRTLTPDWLDLLAWLQVGASSLTMVLVWMATARAFGRAVALAVLGVAAIHIPWIAFAGFAVAETMFTLVLAALALVTTRLCRTMQLLDALAWGALFFAALLLKGTHVIVVIVFFVGLLAYKGAFSRRTWKVLIAISVVVWGGLIAHGFYAQQRIGTFQMTASASGLNFVEGKCPQKRNTDSTGQEWLSPLYFQLGKDENRTWDRPFTDSAYYLEAGLACVKENPLVLIQSLEGIPFLFMGNWMWPAVNLPYADWVKFYEMLFAVFAIAGLSGFAVIGLRRGGGDVVLTWVAPIVGLFLCVYVFKSEVRFRVPFDVWIIPLATAGWFAMWRARPAAPGAAGDQVRP